jgi:predicted RNase H-like HicB family nuclease
VLTYKAMYKYLDQGVHGEVLDFPGVITWGADLEEARRLVASALVDMAETNLQQGEPLPQPDPSCTDPDADLEEPIHLLLTAATRITWVPQGALASPSARL